MRRCTRTFITRALSDPNLLPSATTSDVARVLPVINPSTNIAITDVAQTTTDQVAADLDSAARAQPLWRDTPLETRLAHLQSLHTQVQTHREDLARVITLENGKPYREALAEVDYAASFLTWNAQPALQSLQTSCTWRSPSRATICTHDAVGVVLAVTPFNFPLALLARKVAPALAAGCAVMAKPSEKTPLSALALQRLASRAGVPDGVLSVAVSDDASGVVDAALDADCVRMVSFTGSTKVGKRVAGRAAARVLRVGLELGGNAPFVVFDDADVEAAVDGLVRNKVRCGGQTCVAANRIFAQRGVHDRFVERLEGRLRGVVVGDGFDARVDMGPLIEGGAEKAGRHVDDAIAGGATGVMRGAVDGNFAEVSLVTGATDGMALANEETFGPVYGVFMFDDEDEVVERANRGGGLAAYVYTRGLARAMRMVRRLESGMVGVNETGISAACTQFGGVKESGVGREGGMGSVEEYMEKKYSVLQL